MCNYGLFSCTYMYLSYSHQNIHQKEIGEKRGYDIRGVERRGGKDMRRERESRREGEESCRELRRGEESMTEQRNKGKVLNDELHVQNKRRNVEQDRQKEV